MNFRLIKSKVISLIGRTNPIKYAKKMGVTVGDGCRFVNNPNWGSEPWLIRVGNHVLISNDVMFITHDGSTFVFRETPEYKDVYKFGPITIGDNCFIGARSTILPNVSIGDNCIVGACSLVTHDIPSGEVWGGVPAHKITTTKEYADKCKANRLPYDINAINKHRKAEMLRVIKNLKNE